MENRGNRLLYIFFCLALAVNVANSFQEKESINVLTKGNVVDELLNPVSNCIIEVKGLGYEVISQSDFDGKFEFQFEITKDFFDFNITIEFNFKKKLQENKDISADILISPRKIKENILDIGQVTLIKDSLLKKENPTRSVWGLVEDQLMKEVIINDSLRNYNDSLRNYNEELTRELIYLIEDDEKYLNIFAEMRNTIHELEEALANRDTNLIPVSENEVLSLDQKEVLSLDQKYEYHTVLEGEYLSLIAYNNPYYRDPRAWKILYLFNKDIISNPDLIYPFQIIKIPIPSE